MNIKHTPIPIPTEPGTDPFKNCKLGRKPCAEILTDIIRSYNNGFVLAINNPWGTGKTTFIQMWRQYLINQNFQTIHFNAWENDFDSNPMVALLSELKSLKLGSPLNFKKLINTGAKLSRNLIPVLIKGIAEKHIDSKTVHEAVKAISEDASQLLGEEVEEYAAKKKSLKKFKEELEIYINKSDNQKPLIFLIDELDRCRPDYAVEVLEVIKHFFSVPGIVFVLSIDKEQLGHAVCGVYGSENMDAEEYLRRFIDLEYSLPEPETQAVCEYLYNYFSFKEFIEQESRIGSSSFRRDKEEFLFFSSLLFSLQKVSFRQAEKIFALGRIGLKSVPGNNFFFPPLYILLIYIKMIKPHLYLKIKNKKIEVPDLINEIEPIFSNVEPENNGYNFSLEVIVLFGCFYHNYLYEDVRTHKKIVFDPKEVTENSYLLSSTLDRANNYLKLKEAYENVVKFSSVKRINLNFLIRKIELLEPLISP